MNVSVISPGAFASVQVDLEPGDSFISESGAMVRMSGSVDVDVTTRPKGSKGGLLGGSTKLEHRGEIEVASRLGAPVQVEVRERVPLPDDDEDDVTVTLGKVSPAWEDFEQPRARIKGGKRWRFELAPGDERALSYSYTIQLGGKQELAGGNRRD